MKLKTDAGSLFQPLPSPRIELTAAELGCLSGLPGMGNRRICRSNLSTYIRQFPICSALGSSLLTMRYLPPNGFAVRISSIPLKFSNERNARGNRPSG